MQKACSTRAMSGRWWRRASWRFLEETHNRELIAQLRTSGVDWSEHEKRRMTELPFSGKTFALTGTMSSMTPEQAKESSMCSVPG